MYNGNRIGIITTSLGAILNAPRVWTLQRARGSARQAQLVNSSTLEMFCMQNTYAIVDKLKSHGSTILALMNKGKTYSFPDRFHRMAVYFQSKNRPNIFQIWSEWTQRMITIY
jgi:hypothetical protein